MNGLKNALLAATALLVACGQSVPGSGTADAKAAAGERNLHLAGLTIGMSVAEAAASLRSARWSVVEEKGLTWEQDVNNELARQNVAGRRRDDRGTGVGMLIGSKGEERVEVSFHSAPAPRMGRISEVRYSAPAPGQTPEQMVEALTTKYGRPDRASAPGLPSGATWCAGGPVCAHGRSFGTRTVLFGGQDYLGRGLVIQLNEGSDSSVARRAELMRAVAAAAGARGKPSY